MSRINDEAMRVFRTSLAPILPYMEDDAVNEIMINKHDCVFVERRGKMERIPVVFREDSVETAIRALMSLRQRDISYIMDASLPGFRIACALPPVAIHGAMMVIRKHARSKFKLDDYVSAGSFTRTKRNAKHALNNVDDVELFAGNGDEELAKFLQWAIRNKKNMLLAGGTSSGKTTLLGACLLEIEEDERIITCEDTNEISLAQQNVIQLESIAIPNGAVIAIRDLIRLCLRSRPDRIVVGEIRGQEAYDFIDAMNTGHPGSLCTIHADSAFLALRRLESLIRMSPTAATMPLSDIRNAIATAIDYVVYQSRVDGVRAPEQVVALDGVDEQGNYVWRTIYERFYD